MDINKKIQEMKDHLSGSEDNTGLVFFNNRTEELLNDALNIIQLLLVQKQDLTVLVKGLKGDINKYESFLPE